MEACIQDYCQKSGIERWHNQPWRWLGLVKNQLPSPFEPESSLSSPSSKASSNKNNSSLDYQKKITSIDYVKLKEIHSKINNKCILSSGNSVEDTIYNASKTFNYQQ